MAGGYLISDQRRCYQSFLEEKKRRFFWFFEYHGYLPRGPTLVGPSLHTYERGTRDGLDMHAATSDFTLKSIVLEGHCIDPFTADTKAKDTLSAFSGVFFLHSFFFFGL
jgi:hypothetical protein